MKRLEEIAAAYWRVGTAVRHPKGADMTAGDALHTLNASDRLRPEEWRLAENMHTLRFDLIEGNDKWREKQEARGSASILPIRR